MSENTLCCSRYAESFLPPPLLDKVVLGTQHSVVDAFLGEIEYGKDYILSTELVKEDWADGFGTKYTYFLKFDEIVRCRDCVHYKPYRTHRHGTMNRCHDEQGHTHRRDESDFCSRGERRSE